MSRAVRVTKQGWSTYARDMLAIVVAIQTWRLYLPGHQFIIKTDQSSLRFLLEQLILTPEQQKWMGKLVSYDYEITYKPVSSNKAANALSSAHGSPILNAVFVQQTSLWDDIREFAKTYTYMQQIGDFETSNPGNPYSLRNDLVCYHNRVIVPPSSPLFSQLLREHHDMPKGGHLVVLCTYQRLARKFYWPTMHQIIKEYIAAYDIFQRVKSSSLSPVGLLQPLPILC